MWQFLLVLCLLQFYLGLVWFLPGTKIATDLFEGDIKLKRKTSQAEPRGDILVQRNLVTDTSKQWDPSAIPYQLNTTTLSKHRFVFCKLRVIAWGGTEKRGWGWGWFAPNSPPNHDALVLDCTKACLLYSRNKTIVL